MTTKDGVNTATHEPHAVDRKWASAAIIDAAKAFDDDPSEKTAREVIRATMDGSIHRLPITDYERSTEARAHAFLNRLRNEDIYRSAHLAEVWLSERQGLVNALREARVRSLEAQGLTTSDAQSAVDCEDQKASKGEPYDIAWQLNYAKEVLDRLPAFGDSIGPNVSKAQLFLCREYVIRSAESHADLVAALRSTLEWMEFTIPNLKTYKVSEGMNWGGPIAKARAALAKAEGRA
jgi:hypothetical protein